jgi:hypothetical protein
MKADPFTIDEKYESVIKKSELTAKVADEDKEADEEEK